MPNHVNARKDIIFVSLEDWDSIWRRNQFICDELARRDPKRRILFVGLPLDISNALRRGRFGQLARRASRVEAARDNIIVTSPMKWLPNSLAAGRCFNEAVFRGHVRHRASQLGLKNPLLWLNAHWAAHMVGRMGESGVIYDITDDWTMLTQSERVAEMIRRQDEKLCRCADAVIVCSERLRQMKSGMARNLRLIPNGVDAQHYSKEIETVLAPVARWKHPVVGYVGTIHPDRIDVALVEAIAREMPGASFVLAGPNHLRAEERTRLQQCPNVFFTGPVPYSEVPAYMQAFDVCMTPHRVTPFTESLNPIKLWEYLAVGKPIVSTNVAGFRDYPELVSIASGAREFVDAVRRGIEEGPGLIEKRRELARRNSWKARVDQIEAVLLACETREAAHG